MKKVLFICLILLSVVISSTAFSAIPEGKFPIQFISDRRTPSNEERELIKNLVGYFNNSPKYRVTSNEENRIMLGILINEYTPSVASSDWLASASPINTYSIVWMAKPMNKHAYVIWHDSGRYQTYQDLILYILKNADSIVWKIKNQCPYVFD